MGVVAACGTFFWPDRPNPAIDKTTWDPRPRFGIYLPVAVAPRAVTGKGIKLMQNYRIHVQV
jgi:hypothetical protein